MTTPTSRTLAQLRKEGATAAVVERWLPQARVRRDLFGFADIVALREWPLCEGVIGATQIVAIQCCAMSGRARHLKKIQAEPLHKLWLAAGGLIEVWAWRKTKVRRGGVAVRWTYE